MGSQPSKPAPGTTFRVIGGGMSRTGTKSFTEALTILYDAPVHDCGPQVLVGSPEQRKSWVKVMRLAPRARSDSEKKQLVSMLRELMDGYCGTTDMPSNLLVPELIEAFPDAIVVATTRDAAGWLRSTRRMEAMVHPTYVAAVVFWIPVLGYFYRYMSDLRGLLQWRFGHHLMEITDLGRHEEWLKQIVPPGRLFWFDCREGWEPLCRMLNLPVPDVPFPHNNKPEDGEKAFRGLMIFGLGLWVLVLGITATVGYLGWRYLG